MVDVILDTNIYGKIADDSEQGPELVDRMRRDTQFVVHNFRLIRNELRRAPRILPIYDQLVVRRVIQETKDIRALADAYFKEYKANGGRQGRKKMLNDFKIVACAALNGFDLIVSEDEKTLKHPIARKAYDIVHVKKDLRTPSFYSYDVLKRRFF